MFSRNANMISKPLQQDSSSPFQNDLNVILDSRLNFEEHLNILKKQQDLLPRSALVKSSVIRQRANLKMGVSNKQGAPNFSKIEDFFPNDTHTYVCVSRG